MLHILSTSFSNYCSYPARLSRIVSGDACYSIATSFCSVTTNTIYQANRLNNGFNCHNLQIGSVLLVLDSCTTARPLFTVTQSGVYTRKTHHIKGCMCLFVFSIFVLLFLVTAEIQYFWRNKSNTIEYNLLNNGLCWFLL